MKETKELIEATEELTMAYVKEYLTYDDLKGLDEKSAKILKLCMQVIDASNKRMLAQDREIQNMSNKLEVIKYELLHRGTRS